MGLTDKFALAIIVFIVVIVIVGVICICKKAHESFEKGELVVDLSLDKLKKEVKKDIDAIGIKLKK